MDRGIYRPMNPGCRANILGMFAIAVLQHNDGTWCFQTMKMAEDWLIFSKWRFSQK